MSTPSTTASTPAAIEPRGCGYRKIAGVYLEADVVRPGAGALFVRSSAGTPEVFDRCLFDPPIIPSPTLHLSALGVQLVSTSAPDGTSVTHIFDIVGEESYPDLAGFIAEARRRGVSRRIASTIDFSRLTPASRLVLLHVRAWIANATEYLAARRSDQWSCPKDLAAHRDPSEPPTMCSSLWGEDLEGEPVDGSRDVTRTVGATTYSGRVRPEGVTPEHRLAIFASFPLSGIAVIRDPAGATHEEPLERARHASLPVHLADF